MRNFLIFTIGVGIQFWGAAVLAECAPAAPGTGGDLACTGIDEDGFESEAGSLSILIETGAIVNSASDGHGMDIAHNFNLLSNRGTVNADRDGVRGGQGLTLINEGVIAAGDDGVEISGKGAATLTNNGSIRAGDRAVEMDDDDGVGGAGNMVVNNGQIISDDGEAIEGGDYAIIFNNPGALIKGFDDAIQLGESARILNFGTIQSVGRPDDPQDAIDLDSGSITNGAGAQIISDLDAAIDYDASAMPSYVENAGEIRGVKGIIVELGLDDPDSANVMAQVIANLPSGKIIGSDGTALVLGAGEDVLINRAGGQISGSIQMGEDADTVVLEGSYAGDFGGMSAVVDGGAGEDTLLVRAYEFSQITSVTKAEDVMTLSLDNGVGAFRIALQGWETVTLGGVDHTMQEIAELATP
ncbi:hypothetical protein [uncultured Roseovarius sp.]|uniref:hypothetical protein n=1 Tax=uncultured Roseovarius sp. TaxID=293344 RepID=UPI00262CD14F|nr:hypothetical protein [uncultured Roseovarius sp.]